jgi:signal transduction histidine kinase
LNGYDTEWGPETDLPLAFYTNLRPGRYKFRVKAANDHGIWSDQTTELTFVIAPYFWQTRLFYPLLGAAAVGLAVVLHRRRLRALHRLQELSFERNLADEKERIAADMHDDLAATLTQIVILGERAKIQAAAAPQARATLDRISQAARDLTARMSDLIWIVNPRHDSLENLVVYLRERAARQLEGLPIESKLDIGAVDGDLHVSTLFRRNLLMVATEALHNIVKHSGATEVRMAVRTESGQLIFCIEDNGRGFGASAAGHGNGLGNMRRRVSDLGGSLEFQTAPGQGCRIEVQAPIHTAGAPRNTAREGRRRTFV